jgi:hypothetical protein
LKIEESKEVKASKITSEIRFRRIGSSGFGAHFENLKNGSQLFS